MKTNELVGLYLSCHSHAHAKSLGASLNVDVCYVPGPKQLRDARDDDEASAREAASVCYVP